MIEHARPEAGDATGRMTEGAAGFGRLFVDLLGEQVRHSLEVADVLGQSVARGKSSGCRASSSTPALSGGAD